MQLSISFKSLPNNHDVLFAPAPPKSIVCIGLFEKEPLPSVLKILDEKTNHALSAIASSALSGESRAAIMLGPWQECAIRHLVVFGLGKRKQGNDEIDHWQHFGANVIDWMKAHKEQSVDIWVTEAPTDQCVPAHHVALATGLRSYSFDKHKTFPRKADKEQNKGRPERVTISTEDHKNITTQWEAQVDPVMKGVCFARDLANEPPNFLTPKVYAQRITDTLTPLGVAVRVIGQQELEKIGMGALLAVGQGSSQESHVVVMEWNPKNLIEGEKKEPLAFVGKGVCFDSGGISLKPPRSMDEMRGDMAGSAAVVGAMAALAGRKASFPVVGIVGLVENMPGGDAFRPGDIVTSLSGQTIEVLNTDAEGRLVLADLLTYVQDHYAPQRIIDLATLTGAIVVSLGSEYAGLFSNDKKLAKILQECGEQVKEHLWSFPLDARYDKKIDSSVADMKNISSGMGAGSITAAQFLGRFVHKGMAWAHIDIAGVGIKSPKGPLNTSWASGFGVRLLDHFVREYE